MRSSRHRGSRQSGGFTLVELAFSLLIVLIGVISVMLILPIGIKAQQHSRDQIISSAIALHLMEMAYNHPLPKWLRTPSPVFRTEVTHTDGRKYHVPFVPDMHGAGGSGQFPIPNPVLANALTSPDKNLDFFTIRNQPILFPDPVVHAPDLEHIVHSHYHGIRRIPSEMAMRFESDDDLIRAIVAQGGSLYCIGPRSWTYQADMTTYSGSGTRNLDSINARGESVPEEVQNLVFAVVGYAQRNAELICQDTMFPGYVDLRQDFPRAVRIYPPTRPLYYPGAGSDQLPGKVVDANPGARQLLAANVAAAPSSSSPSGRPYSGRFAPIDDYAPYNQDFSPSERCRQLVFWKVDWRGYQDAETMIRQPEDRYRFPALSLLPQLSSASLAQLSSAKKYEECGPPIDVHDPATFWPSRWYHYAGTSRGDPSGKGTFGKLDQDTNSGIADFRISEDLIAGGSLNPNAGIRRGVNGCDVNGNMRQDRGSIAPTVRLRAVVVARYNYYDPRVWLTLNRALPVDQ